jgi:Ribosomal protein L11 methyltransferase (PrmA)
MDSQHVIREVMRAVQSTESDARKIHFLRHLMIIARREELSQGLLPFVGNTAIGGPFKGLKLIPEVMNGNFMSLLLGIYEHELHQVVEDLIARQYQTVLNIGCSIGYYAVGMAARLPAAKIYAYDIEPTFQEACRQIAALNGVADRVIVGGLFRGENFANFTGQKTLLICDIEGAELDLLNPTLYPALQKMDILVELHDCFNPVISTTILSRFQSTHDIENIVNDPVAFPLERLLGQKMAVEPLDGAIIAYEGRRGPTPWAILKTKG